MTDFCLPQGGFDPPVYSIDDAHVLQLWRISALCLFSTGSDRRRRWPKPSNYLASHANPVRLTNKPHYELNDRKEKVCD